jgi:hypothetical protein
MNAPKLSVSVLAILFLPLFIGGQTRPSTDVWEPLKFFVGKWEGTGSGQPGVSKVQREYQMVLKDKFMQVQNRSTYEPQSKNPKGEIHDDWGMIGFDKTRKQFVLRQFHVEGFVIQYVLTSVSPDGKTIVFTSESIENIPAGWRSRETYKIVSADEFVEVFELAGPGKDFQVYSESRLLRKK